ncbi:MAG: methyltransferase domain-containing protein [Bacteroidales bacterium]|nr:methyltransferase domain-containing protein [Bacteroidales bacterium]
MEISSGLYLNLYRSIRELNATRDLNFPLYMLPVLADYLLRKENAQNNSQSPLLTEKDLLKKLETKLFPPESGNDANLSSKSKLVDIKEHMWYPFLVNLQGAVLFYAQNEAELKYFSSVLDPLNRLVVVLCDFTPPENDLPKWLILMELDFCDQKVYENEILRQSLKELYDYHNTFAALLDIMQPLGIVVLNNSSFQKHILSHIGREKQIPVIALKSDKEYSFPSDHQETIPSDYSIDLKLPPNDEEKQEVSMQIAKEINKRIPYSYFKKSGEPRLHIGCGTCVKTGWLNSDMNFTKDIIFLDAEKKFPFPDSSFRYVFSEHLFEHLSYKGGKNMLQEVYRVLKPQGIFRLTMPGLEFLIKLYEEKDNELYDQYIDWSISSFAPGIKEDFEQEKVPPMFIVNNFMRFFAHKMIYDKETITYLLKKTGFKNVSYPKIGESVHPVFSDIEQHGKVIPEWANNLESFVVEAQK